MEVIFFFINSRWDLGPKQHVCPFPRTKKPRFRPEKHVYFHCCWDIKNICFAADILKNGCHLEFLSGQCLFPKKVALESICVKFYACITIWTIHTVFFCTLSDNFCRAFSLPSFSIWFHCYFQWCKLPYHFVDGRSARGRPRFGWMNGVKRAQNDRRMDVREASEHARNRNEWQTNVTQFWLASAVTTGLPYRGNPVSGAVGAMASMTKRCGRRGRMGCVAPAVPLKLGWVPRHC